MPSSPCLLTHTRHRGATRPPRGDRDWLSEPGPVEPGGLTFGPIGPGPVSAPLMPVFPPVGIDARRGLWVSQPPPANQAFCSQHAAGERSAAPPSPSFCTCAPTAVRQCPLGSVLAGEQPYRSRSAAVSRSERSAQAPRPPLPALATDLTACSISRPSARKLSMISMVERNIKSWTTAARISRSERRSSQKPRAAKDRC